MNNTRTYTFSKAKRPTTKAEIQARRLRHAKASLEIEGLYLTCEEIVVFEECIRNGCSLEERTSLLKKRFPHYDRSLRT
ncbi:hypothetical protein [Desulfovibrio psychrotolerans]|uniref:Uncharacterized protein n=1 Tax=Desulfovibrio psychrotolerans TaxID=415242 RepID=A0A7J0BR67_9BACT|nr:hypothetical protein [Desulfovibrio psychrotolerans]GFM36213.1 hypothetical protein DSM19430T_08970 [Desulfovibrio psychrotolerans]